MRTAVRRLRGRGFDLVAMLVIGVVVVGAALLPAVTANSGETLTVRGDVTASGEPLAFYPVGFWSPTAGVLRTTQTDANGGFTIDVPATIDGYAYAGTAPDAPRAVTAFAGEQYVRGVIGRTVTKPSAPLYQWLASATGRSLNGGAKQLHFLLQHPGTVAGTAPVSRDRIRALQVRRLDGSVLQTMSLDSRGRFRSASLVPGDYAVALVPKAPELPVVSAVTVEAGRTETVRLAAPEDGATVTGTVRTESGAVGRGVPVLLLQDGAAVASTTTASNGAYRFTGVAAGDFTVEAGRYEEVPRSGAAAVQVPIPGASSTPTPTPSATAPATQDDAVLQPVERTSDEVLPGSATVSVPSTLGEVSAPVDVTAAGRVSGTVARAEASSGADAAPVRVLVEDPSTGRIVRAASAGSDGKYSIGGLEQGEQYEVWAVSEPQDPTLALMGHASALATASTTRVDVALDEPALTVGGTVADATGGTVTVGAEGLFQRSASLDGSGAYAVQGLVPARYPVVVAASGRVDSAPVALQVAARAETADQQTAGQQTADQQEADLQPGQRPATVKAWFISNGAGVALVSGTATSAIGDTIRIGPTTSSGHVALTGLVPGTYTYDDDFRGSAPVADGPWFFLPPTGTFSLSDGAVTDLGPVVLRLRSH